MKTTGIWVLTAGLAGVLSLGALAQTPAQEEKPKLSMTRMHTGSDGKTHFEQTDLQFPEANGRMAPLKLRGKTGAELSPFRASPPGAKITLHPVATRLWEFGIIGRSDVGGAGDKTFNWQTGIIELLEDTSGKGHGAIIRESGVMLKIPDGTPLIAPSPAALQAAKGAKDALFYRLFTSGAEGSTFTDVPIVFTDGVFKLGDTGVVLRRRGPLNGPNAWHNQKEPEYVVTLRGSTIIESTSGETVALGPGSIALIEDATGGGHRTKTQGPGDLVFLQIPVAAKATP